MSNITDAFQQVIEQAVEAAVRRALSINEATNRRLFTIEECAVYLSLSEREIDYMIVRRKMLDIRDLDEWIVSNKADRIKVQDGFERSLGQASGFVDDGLSKFAQAFMSTVRWIFQSRHD
jgi:hypothetical protein